MVDAEEGDDEQGDGDAEEEAEGEGEHTGSFLTLKRFSVGASEDAHQNPYQ